MPELSIEKYAQKIHYFTEPLIFPLKPINMVLIPGGTFQMGSPETELDGFIDCQQRQNGNMLVGQVLKPHFIMGKLLLLI